MTPIYPNWEDWRHSMAGINKLVVMPYSQGRQKRPFFIWK